MKQDQADKFNLMIDEAIKDLSSDSIKKGAESLVEIAKMWAKAGLPQDSFENIRKYIIKEAIAKTDEYFIMEKLGIAERSLREKRTNSIIMLN